MSLLGLIPDSLKLPVVGGIGIILGVALSFYPARWLGQSEGKQMAAAAALSKSVQVLRERNTINAEVSSSDAAALCHDLGLLDDEQAECVRRLAETPVERPDSGLHNPERPDACERDRKS
jgi:hypothetical protein